MDRNEFISKVKAASNRLDEKALMDVIQASIESFSEENTPRGHENLIIVMEELSELTKELTKELRGKGDPWNILQELADVALCIRYVQEICGISKSMLNKAVNVKATNLGEVLVKEGIYR